MDGRNNMQNNNDEPQSQELEIITPTALESLERATIDMQVATAKRFPRSLAVVKKRMLDLATLDQETAASCFYRLNRQGKMIEGPTIRLAEIAGSSFGNLRYGARVISNDGKVITAQGYCFDLETNVMSQVEVQRRITNREGQKYSEDMQVVTGNAACAIAARNAVFKVVPFAFIKPIFTAAKKAAVGDIKTLDERRTQMLKAFAALGVNEKRILATLEKNGIEEIGLTELETLIGLHNAIEDKEQTVEEAFPVAIEKPKFSTPHPEPTPATPEPEKPKNKGGRPRKLKIEPSPTVTDSVGISAPIGGPGFVESTPIVNAPTDAHPLATEIEKRLDDANFSVLNLYNVAVANKWVAQLPTPPTTVAQMADEEKCETFLDKDNWKLIMGALEQLNP